MKRCPKCNRTFPEESQKFCTVDGGLLITEPAFDPNMTIRATSDDLGSPTIGFANEQATSRKLPDLEQQSFRPRLVLPELRATFVESRLRQNWRLYHSQPQLPPDHFQRKRNQSCR